MQHVLLNHLLVSPRVPHSSEGLVSCHNFVQAIPTLRYYSIDTQLRTLDLTEIMTEFRSHRNLRSIVDLTKKLDHTEMLSGSHRKIMPLLLSGCQQQAPLSQLPR